MNDLIYKSLIPKYDIDIDNRDENDIDEMENDINQILTIYVNTIESLIEYITVNSICEHLSPENVKNIENVLLIIYK